MILYILSMLVCFAVALGSMYWFHLGGADVTYWCLFIAAIIVFVPYVNTVAVIGAAALAVTHYGGMFMDWLEDKLKTVAIKGKR